ncbi:MAG: Nif11 family protein [Leptolyngbya sp. SIO4C1]|nr:Nif11 family protein [Leptolyngbya sp. SIO4C1]
MTLQSDAIAPAQELSTARYSVIRFLQAMSQPGALAERLKSIDCSAELLEVATEFGYQFSAQEFWETKWHH